MRYHSRHRVLDCWRDAGRLRRVVSAQTLVAARFEPLYQTIRLESALDLVFARDGELAIVPFVIVDGAMLQEIESSPLVWPLSVHAALSEETVEALEAELLPWLTAQLLHASLTTEQIRRYDAPDGAWEQFEGARDLGLLGAASYARVLEASAPYAFVARMARGKDVAVRDEPAAGTGLAILARHARRLQAGLGDAFAAVRAWYGLDALGELDENAPQDLFLAREAPAAAAVTAVLLDAEVGGGRVVRVARPVPMDVMLSFDPTDSECARVFSVVTRQREELRRPLGGATPAPVGGSSGRVVVALRDDWRQHPDSDSDEACELARRLNAEGFSVDVRGLSESIVPGSYDLGHAIGLSHPSKTAEFLKRFAEAGVPAVLTPQIEDVEREGAWGTAVTGVFLQVSLDEVALRDHLRMLALRRLDAEGVSKRASEPFEGYAAAVREALDKARAVIVSSAAEGRFLAERFEWGGTPVTAAPCVSTDREVEPIAGLVGTEDFILAHAPIERRCNQLLLARAAAAAGLPLVIVGPVSEKDYYTFLQEHVDERTIVLTDLSEECVAALYRRARVFANVSWMSFGLSRTVRAALCGCALVLPAQGFAAEQWRPGLWEVDPASVDGIARGLEDAWLRAADAGVAEAASRIAAACDPVLALVSTVAAYARA